MDQLDPAEAKTELRNRLIEFRRQRSDADRAEAAKANGRQLRELLDGAAVVCGYLPLPSEPLSVALLDALVAAGTSVLVPVVAENAPLDWCRYPAPTSPGRFGIAEPDGPRLGPSAVRSATAVLVPALAVDGFGSRLGRGGGHYDRTLALLHPDRVQLVAVLFDGEIVSGIPTGPHDVPVTAAVTPTGGIAHFRR